MSYKKSFSEVESKYWGDYKSKISKAEGIEDVKKIFSMTIANMVKEIEPKLNPVYEEFGGDFEISSKEEKKYKVSTKIGEDSIYKDLVENSDLNSIIYKFADMAVNKKIHLSRKEAEENGKKIIH